MLPKKHRLPLRTELVWVQKEGKLFQGRLFSLLVAESTPEVEGPPEISRGDTSGVSESSRFAFIISTKIHKKATKRNRARRLLVEAIRGLLPKIKPGFDCVFLTKKAIIGQELDEIKKETEKLFKKANLTI